MEARNSWGYAEVAAATSANFEIEVREYHDFPGVYKLSFISRLIKCPPLSLEFTLHNLKVLRQALSLLQAGSTQTKRDDVVLLGHYFGRCVRLSQDDDWPNRFFIVVRDDEYPRGDILQLTIAGDDVEPLVAVLQAIVDELEGP